MRRRIHVCHMRRRIQVCVRLKEVVINAVEHCHMRRRIHVCHMRRRIHVWCLEQRWPPGGPIVR
jgi:hypothetical protein